MDITYLDIIGVPHFTFVDRLSVTGRYLSLTIRNNRKERSAVGTYAIWLDNGITRDDFICQQTFTERLLFAYFFIVVHSVLSTSSLLL